MKIFFLNKNLYNVYKLIKSDRYLKKICYLFLILDLYIFLRNLIIGSINVLKNNSSNTLHNQIRRNIKSKNGKVLIVGCGTSLLDIPKPYLNKINKNTSSRDVVCLPSCIFLIYSMWRLLANI